MVSGLLSSALGNAAYATNSVNPGFRVHYGHNGETDINVCSDAVPAGHARCLAVKRTDTRASDARPARSRLADIATRATQSAVLGNNGAYDPSYLQSAYNAPSATAGTGQTVAIVDAYDDPNAEADLAHYRSYFGLQACTTANGCFRKVDEGGGTSYPVPNSSWSQEISLDLDMVSAMCPRCNILLVEATSDYFTDLGTAVNTAVNLGANVVSNSYGMSESRDEYARDAAYYNHPGVAIVASSGDSGYGTSWPAASPDLVAVGGTSLHQLTNSGTRNATETTWNLAGGGCSVYEAKPTWQLDAGCPTRTVADVSAVADPATGVWVYDTYGALGFKVLGGTSASAPIVGAMYALAANPASSDTLASYPYDRPTSLNDVTSGANGSCAVSYFCTATTGYDGPTGLGTPNGVSAFTLGVPPSTPDSPLVSLNATTATLNWTPPATDGGSQITDYTITPYRAGAPRPSTSVTAPLTTINIGALTPGQTYTFTVTAQNAIGSSAPSTPSAPVTVANAPGPDAITSVVAGNGTATLRWIPPANNGGPPITAYKVTPYIRSVGPQSPLLFGPGVTTATLRGLANGYSYTFTVAAQNTIGLGSQSPSTSPVTIGSPSVPSGASASWRQHRMIVHWVPSRTGNGAAVSGYVVTPYLGRVARPSHIAQPNANALAIIGLAPGKTYTFRIQALNTRGNSPASMPTNPVRVPNPS
jgi:hypothetical protein